VSARGCRLYEDTGSTSWASRGSPSPWGDHPPRTAAPVAAQPQFGMRGPLHVFGPYTERHGQIDHARMRTTPAYFRDSSGTSYLFVTGASKAASNSAISVPPGLVRLRVVAPPGAPAYLAADGRETRTTLVNRTLLPHSPPGTSQRFREVTSASRMTLRAEPPRNSVPYNARPLGSLLPAKRAHGDDQAMTR